MHKSFWINNAIFLIVLTGIFFFLGFGKTFFSWPQGIHFMRQTDSLSFAHMFINDGFDFFNPKLFNLKNIDGRAACEFPVTYYITAILYSIFGKHIFILKGIHLIIAYTGLICVYKIALQSLKDKIYAALISLFLFTSTVFNYYSFNFLPDPAALGLTFIAWYYFFKFYSGNNKNSLLTAFVLFALAGLIKITYLINPIAIFILLLYSLLFDKNEIILNKNRKRIFIYFFIGVIAVIFWNGYTIYYNSIYESTSFNTKAHPIWNMSKENIVAVWHYMFNYWYSKYLAHSSFHLLLILIPIQIVFFNKSIHHLSILTLLLFLGSLIYFILFYSQFRDHDYYFLTFLPFIVFVLINGIKTLQNLISNKKAQLAFKAILLIIVIVGINYSRLKLNDRYNERETKYSQIGFIIQANYEAINELKLSKDAKFIIAPDLTQNAGLLFINKMGWNMERPKGISIEKINTLKAKGAEYLLLASDEKRLKDIADETGNLILEGRGLHIYTLSGE